ncbi:SDR family NAD(P)-dependent oxidoreductase [Dactylosporangium sp. CS-033363]|uniref:SDR family NAD(P)-dependent oxidoreductase n=1 Tax=Dactylosporangium sp. CS-033363 TaxID=3239935 RepID=UPI003D920CE8
MTDRTIAVLGAGTGLGTAVARRFGREGFRVALVARTADRLHTLAATLADEEIEAIPFPADLTNAASVPPMLQQIEQRLGPIDVLEYAPITTGLFGSMAALDAATVQAHLNLHLLTPIELVGNLLPTWQKLGNGAFLLAQGISAVHPMPRLGALGPSMAAARNWVLALHEELAGTGVYAGVVHVGAMVTGSAAHRTFGAAAADFPQIDPAAIADTMWSMYTARDRAEQILS